jgi:VCBS repeat-containing protein
MFIFPAVALAQDAGDSTGTPAPSPTIQSDQEDYPPGGSVILTGSNWQPGETVNINVNDDAGQTWNRNVDVIADENGNVRDEFALPDWFVAVYYVTATGADSGSVAKTTFTDGDIRVTSTGLTNDSQEWRLTDTPYSALNCTGTAGSINTQDVKRNVTKTFGRGPTQSIKLTASEFLKDTTADTSPLAFSSWTIPSGVTVTGTTDGGRTICVNGSNSNFTLTANYVTNNRPPLNSLPGTTQRTTLEDTAKVWTGTVGSTTRFSISDPDAGTTNPVQVTLSVTNGTLSLGGTTGLTFSAGDGTSDTTMTFTGTIPAINTALNNLRYDPAANFNGTATLTIATNDQGHTGVYGGPKTDTDNVSITVTSVNDQPVAVPDSATTADDTASEPIDVLANDTGLGDGGITVSIFSQGTQGTATVNGDNTITYTPGANASGTDSFTYRVTDANGSVSNAALVSVTITPSNQAPVAVDDEGTTNEDVALIVEAPGVLGNDTDEDGDDLTAEVVAGPSSGELTLNPDGSYTYTPDPDFFGSDSFTYKTNDGTTDSNTATVTITVNAVNDPPDAVNDDASGTEDTDLTIDPSDLLANDTDPDGDTLTLVGVSNPTGGSVSVNDDGDIVFTPAANLCGTDVATFDYTVDDGSGANNSSDTATVTIDLTCENDAPVAADDAYSVNEDNTLTANGGTNPNGVLFNDTDAEDDSLTATLGDNVDNGSLALNGDGTFTYTPNPNFFGEDSFTYTADDGNGGTDTATVAITVNAVNDPPTISDIANQETDEDVSTGAINFTVGDVETAAGSLQVSGSSSNTTLVPNDNIVFGGTGADRTVTITPADNEFGTATITVTVTDADGSTASDTFTLTVNSVNDDPVITSVTNNGPVNEGSPATITVTANDDADGDTLSYEFDCGNDGTYDAAAQPGNTYQCTFNDEGTGSYTVNARVTDGNSGSDTGSTSVVVTNVAPSIGALNFNGTNSGTACISSGKTVTLSFSITDPGSADFISGTISWGDGTTTEFNSRSVSVSHTYPSGAGSYTVNVVANDGDLGIDNTASDSPPTSGSVSLLYNVSELQAPVNPTGMTMSVFKSGSTIPLRVLITDCNNQPVNGLVPKITFNKLSPSTPVIGVNENLSTQPNDTNFLMRDAGNGQYIYNLNTKALPDQDATYNATIRDSKATQTAPATYGPKVTQTFGIRTR